MNDRRPSGEVIAELTELIGLPALLALAEERGGVRLYVPHRPDGDHELVRLIGQAATIALVKRYAGETIEVPRCAARLRAIRDSEIRAEDKLSIAEMAQKYGLTMRRIVQIRGVVPDSRQRSLF